MLYKAKGILHFNPKDVTQKHREQAEWKKIAMIVIDGDVDRYYSWFVNKRFSLKLTRNLRGAHVTFISDKGVDVELFDQVAAKYEGKEVEFFYSNEPFTNGKHWWLRVFCTDIEPIREELGLHKYPYFGIHLTLGRISEPQTDHGIYIKEVCDFNNLLHNEPRKPLEEYKIVNENNDNSNTGIQDPPEH